MSGVPANQIVIGLAFYGRGFKLKNANQSFPGAPALGPGSDGGEGIPVNKVCFHMEYRAKLTVLLHPFLFCFIFSILFRFVT